MSTKATRRRASRLSEGSAVRPLDYAVEYAAKSDVASVLRGPREAAELIFSIEKEQSTTWPNRLYLGDNVGVLRTLLDDNSVCGKVRLIYIDPPFATGAVFESRSGRHAYEDLTHGANFLEFLRQRLILLRELLHDGGSIYVHLDEKMAFPTKVVMDEIFGASNFRNFITRQKSNRKNFTRKQYGNISDYILFYSKTSEYVWNRPFEDWTDDWAAREYGYTEERTGRRYKKVPVHAPGVRNGETGSPWRGKLPPPGKHWQYPPRVLDELDAKGEIYWSPTGNPRRKIYFDQSKGVAVQDIWLDCRDAHNQNIEVTGYPTEKPLSMLRRIVDASSHAGDLVLDCFCGSGTTLVAAEQSDRSWIGIDAGIEAISTTMNRLASGSERMGDFVNGKRPKEAALFDVAGVLRSAFDFYVASGPARVSADLPRQWESLF